MKYADLSDAELEIYHGYMVKGNVSSSQALYRIEQRRLRQYVSALKSEDIDAIKTMVKAQADAEYAARVAEQRHYEEAQRKRREFIAGRARALLMPVIGSLPEVDTDVDGIVAFRVWNTTSDNRLRSTAYTGHCWNEVTFADVTPTEYNQSGLYCVKLEASSLLSGMSNYFHTGRLNVCGFIELRGRVVEHTDGVMRAEAARILCLFVTSEYSGFIEEIVASLHQDFLNIPIYVVNPDQLSELVMVEAFKQGRRWRQ